MTHVPVDAPPSASTKSDTGVKSGTSGPHVPGSPVRDFVSEPPPAPTTMPGWPHASVPPHRRRPRRWVGRAVPARRDLRRLRAPTSRCSPASPRASSCACSGPTATAPRCGSSSPRSTATAGTPTCPTSGPASATATGCTGRGSPDKGLWCNPSKLLLDPYAKAIDGEVDWDPACFAYDFDDPGRDEHRRQRAARAPRRRRRPVLRLGQRPPAGPRDARHRSSTRPTSRASPSATRPCPRRCAARTRASPTRPSSSTSPVARHHGHRADAGAPVRPRPPPRRARPAQLLGLQLDRLPRPAQRLHGGRPRRLARRAADRRRRPAADARCRSSRRWSRRCTRAGIEVILDVVYNHTAEGNHMGPMLSMRGIDNLAYYRVDGRRAPPLPRLHGHRQQPQRAPPARAAADHGQPALLGDRDARRRLPLRPGVDAGPRAATPSTGCRRSSTSSSRTRSCRR